MDDTLEKKVRQRRRAMNISANTSSLTSHGTKIEQDEHDDAIEAVSEAESSHLQENLDHYHDAIRKKLHTSEIEAIQSDVGGDEVNHGPTISMARSQELQSSQADLNSTLDSTFDTRASGTHMSLRSRLQAKLQVAKEQRGLSPSDHSRSKTKRLRDRIVLTTRFSDPLHLLGRPDMEKEEELDSKVAAKLRWKRLIEKNREQVGQPAKIECYDFFTKQYKDIPIDQTESEQPITEHEEVDETAREVQETPEAEEALAHEDTEDDKKKVEDIIPSELDWRLFNITAAEYTSYRSRLEVDRQVNFVPSMLDAPAESKVLDDTQPVYLEEEGFYVGQMPEVQRRNRNILENRILQLSDQGQVWFGMDGRVKCLSNPVKTTATKPWIYSLEGIDQSIAVQYVKAYETTVEDKYIQGAEEHEIQLDLGTVVFHHHPFMSREHVLASNLNEMYHAYIRHRQKNYATFYNDKLRTLRLALKAMKKNAVDLETSDNIPATSSMDLRLQDYINEIRRTCRQRDIAEAYERDLVRRMYSEWSEIKSLREMQGFNNTSIKLMIKKQEVGQGDQHEWMEEIEKQFKECSEEYEYTILYPFRRRMVEYKKNLQEWEATRVKLKRQSDGLKNENMSDVPPADGEESLVTHGINPKPFKPASPDKFDEATVRNRLIQQALQHRRNPGEAKISLEVTQTGPVTPNSQVPPGELSRRTALQNAGLFAKVRINAREVCTTDTKTITSDFKVHFGQIFKIRITQWPDSFKVLLCEDGLVNRPTLCEIELGIPDGSVNAKNCYPFPVDFSSNRLVTCSHEGVGSCTPFTLRLQESSPVSLKIRGHLLISVAWGIGEDGKVLAPKLLMQGLDTLEMDRQQYAIHDQGLNPFRPEDHELGNLWSQEGRLDPNDPANAAAVPYAKEGIIPAADYFRLDQLQEEFNFISDEELDRARRLRVLEYRNKGIPEFRNIKMVPANEHEVLDSAFTTFERRKREKDALGEMGEKKVVAGTLSAHRLEVLRFRQRIRDSVLRRFFSARRYHTLQDMVHEEQVPDIGTLGVKLLKVLEPRRPLKPVRSERKRATAQNLTEGSVTILVSVIRAYNLPVRDKLTSSNVEGPLSRVVLGTASQRLQEDGETNHLSPFVSVSFQGNIKTTNTAQGPNPSWNEELELPFSAPNNDYAPENLQTVDDTLFLHVFDRVVYKADVDDRDRNEVGETSGVVSGIVSHRTQNHWLGSLKVPFSTIYQQGRIDGTFKLSIPLVMLGYTFDQMQTSSTDPYTRMESRFLQPSDGSYVAVFITLQPELGRPEPIQQKFETQEDRRLIAESLSFVEECRKKFPKRSFKTTVIDIKGECVFITRYVRPLQPPAVLLEGGSQMSLVTAEKLARFVSLIPFVSDNVIYAGTCDLWSTCDQFLNMLCGDEEEHAVLLLNFFLSIGKQAYLVLGNAIPEGETAYVLTLESSQEYLLWNASTGQNYKTTNSVCPLQNVHALVNQDNLWFNMQQHDIPSRVNFNIHSGQWKPLFKSSQPQLASVQPDSLTYPDVDLAYVRNLEERIERALKDSIMSWRPRHITRWNRSCSNVLLQILRGLENDRWKSMTLRETTPSTMSVFQGDHADQLSRLIGAAEFVGFPMDMPFTDIDAVVEIVRSTEVHKIQNDDIEFAVAVHIHPYPASVLCVWVYVAALNARRTI